MFRFIVLTVLLGSALGYGGRKGYPNAPPAVKMPSYAPAEYEPSYPKEAPAAAPQAAYLPVQSTHQVRYIDVPASYESNSPLTVHMAAPADRPVHFSMRSRSAPLNIEHTHEGSQGSYQATSSEDAAHVRVHTVTRPVIQEVREIITPYRKYSQEVRAVQEESEAIVAKQQAAYQAPKPAYQAPKPAYQAPKPAYQAPKPAYQAPKPAYQAPKLAYQAPKAQPAYPKVAPIAPASYQKPPVRTYAKPVAPKMQPTYARPARTYQPQPKLQPSYEEPAADEY